MAVLRVVVDDVDDSLEALLALGFTLKDRWGPPFAILSDGETDVWLSGPQSSAYKLTSELPEENRLSASNRVVSVTENRAQRMEEMKNAGWKLIGREVSGPGGSQQLMMHGSLIVEVFEPG